MLNLDQVRLLENRVEKAVGKIQYLTAENVHLRSQLSGLQARVGELEGLVRSFRDDQGRIEEGILNALDRLSAFEDSVFNAEPKQQSTVSPSQTADTEPQEQSETVSEPEEDLLASIEASIQTGTAAPADSFDLEAAQEPEKNAQTPVQSDGQMDIF